MKSILLFSLLCCCVLQSEARFIPSRDLIPLPVSRTEQPTPVAAFENRLFRQLVDHAKPEGAVFNQRYFVSSTYAEGTHSGVLFYMCGEWTCDATEVDMFLAPFARKYKMHMVGVEHRYYGESLVQTRHPQTDWSHLSLQAALDDMVTVQDFLKSSRQWTGPWFSYGISYGGTMAAYYRLLHPDKMAGAFAFSAPMYSLKDGFTGYEETALRAFGLDLSRQVKESIRILSAAFGTAEGKQKIISILKTGTDLTKKDFLSMLVALIPQYAQRGGGIKVLTSVFATAGDTATEEAWALLTNLNWYFSYGGQACWAETPYGVAHATEYTNTETWVIHDFRDFGWTYVNADYTSDDYKADFAKLNLIGADFLSSQMPQAMTREQVSKSSRILFFNGTFDPWSAISYMDFKDTKKDLLSFNITGGAHGAGASPRSSTPDERSAREFLENYLVKWSH